LVAFGKGDLGLPRLLLSASGRLGLMGPYPHVAAVGSLDVVLFPPAIVSFSSFSRRPMAEGASPG